MSNSITGLDDESQHILSELRNSTDNREDDVMGVDGGAAVDDDGDADYEDLPESLGNNKAFVCALRDVVDSRCVGSDSRYLQLLI